MHPGAEFGRDNGHGVDFSLSCSYERTTCREDQRAAPAPLAGIDERERDGAVGRRRAGKVARSRAAARRIVWNIRRLLDAAAVLGVPTAATEQYPDKLSPTVPELKERLGKIPDKLCFSACVCGAIFEGWRADGLYRVLVCGIETHVCVMQTALDLVADGLDGLRGGRCGRCAARRRS